MLVIDIFDNFKNLEFFKTMFWSPNKSFSVLKKVFLGLKRFSESLGKVLVKIR